MKGSFLITETAESSEATVRNACYISQVQQPSYDVELFRTSFLFSDSGRAVLSAPGFAASNAVQDGGA